MVFECFLRKCKQGGVNSFGQASVSNFSLFRFCMSIHPFTQSTPALSPVTSLDDLMAPTPKYFHCHILSLQIFFCWPTHFLAAFSVQNFPTCLLSHLSLPTSHFRTQRWVEQYGFVTCLLSPCLFIIAHISLVLKRLYQFKSLTSNPPSFPADYMNHEQ